MRKIFTYLLSATVATVLALPVYADYFDSQELVGHDIFGNEYGATLTKFGGCEQNTCTTYDRNLINRLVWVIGDLSLKQGVYWLTAPQEHDHGKLKLKYDYKLVTDDSHSNSTDYGRIRIKDVATDEILYEKVVTPDKTGDWRNKIVTLPGVDATKNLQLVFEANNDDSGLTQLYIRNWKFEHKSEPQITGKITYKVNGETRYATNALVALQNKARTKTYSYTRTNDRGEYTFFPVASNQRYTIAATLDEYDGLKIVHDKVKNGHEYTANFKLTAK